jgi:hypothetical protein
VAARVVESPDLAVVIPQDDDAVPADLPDDEVAAAPDLLLPPGVQPAAGEDSVDLFLKYFF